jgi:hypothetical protein
MRSLGEIRFRLKQELANLRLIAAPPDWSEPLAGPLPGLPDPETLVAAIRSADSAAAYRRTVVSLAEELLTHRFRLLGLAPADLGNPIRWRRDFVHGHETGTGYFRSLSYLDFSRAGDHKIIWELNRHQHLVLLAQAFLLTRRREFLEEIPRQLDGWMRQNPTARGINWASALEVAFRAWSWMWVLHLAGREFPEDFRRRWMQRLYHHGLYLERNLSIYFSPNTHLLGEAVMLAALGKLLPQMPRAARWRELGEAMVLEQMRRQVRNDGSHFEQSAYYHLYAVDLFLLHRLLHPDTPEWFDLKLEKMAEFLHALVSASGLLALIGDEDGGRLFHPYGDRRRFAEATLASCARWRGRPEWMRNPAAEWEQSVWWMGPGPLAAAPAPASNPTSSRWFADAGLAVLRSGGAHALIDAGGFGSGSAGHSHADTLSLVAFRAGEELLIDPGTFTYVSDPNARQRFRSTAAHNTVSINSQEQAEAQGPFRWNNPPRVELLHWNSTEVRDILDARCRYRGFTHRRSVVFLKPDWMVVLDRVSGPEGIHRVEQRWLTPEGVAGEFLDTRPAAIAEPAERSAAFGSREGARRWIARWEGKLPANLVAVICFGGGRAAIQDLTIREGVRVKFEGGEVYFPAEGPPRL